MRLFWKAFSSMLLNLFVCVILLWLGWGGGANPTDSASKLDPTQNHNSGLPKLHKWLLDVGRDMSFADARNAADDAVQRAKARNLSLHLDTTSVDSLLQSANNVLRQGLSKKTTKKLTSTTIWKVSTFKSLVLLVPPPPLLLTIQLERLSSPPSFLNKLKDLLTAEAPSQGVGDTLPSGFAEAWNTYMLCAKPALGIGASPQTLAEFYRWSQRMRRNMSSCRPLLDQWVETEWPNLLAKAQSQAARRDRERWLSLGGDITKFDVEV
jgi:hypothetical protein